jgi:glycosyltransferase involved in cell wall biosynthesis
LGVIAAEPVLDEMRNSDAVVVPSRHDYSEGLPNTIFEALASRSPHRALRA